MQRALCLLYVFFIFSFELIGQCSGGNPGVFTPIWTSQPERVSCMGASDGEIQLAGFFSSSGTTFPYTYEWVAGSPTGPSLGVGTVSNDFLSGGMITGTSTISGLASSTVYYLIVCDNSVPAKTQTIAFYVNHVDFFPLILVDSIQSASCGLPNGSVFLTVDGGMEPLTYQWDDPNSQTTSFATGLQAGTYLFTFYDYVGCPMSTTVSLSDNGMLNTSITSIDSPSCYGYSDGAINTSSSGGNTPYTYTWSYDNSVTTQNVSGIDGGIHSVSVQDLTGCQSVVNVTVNDPQGISLSIIELDAITCYGYSDGVLLISTNGYNSPYTYEWETGSTDLQISGLSSGTYSLSVTTSSTCVESSTISISDPNEIIVSVSEEICDNDSLWLSGAFQNSGGIYFDTLQSIEGCDSIVETTLIILPSYMTSITESICSGDSILLQGSYQNSSGTYYDSLSSAQFCDSIIVTQLSIVPTYNLGSFDTIYDGDSIAFGNGYVTSSGNYAGTYPSVYGCDSTVWLVLTVLPNSLDTCVDFDIIDLGMSCPTVVDLVCGCDGNVYGNSCEANNWYGITTWDDAFIMATDNWICSGDSVQLMASPGQLYLWSTGSNDSTIFVSPSTTTTYTVDITTRYGCQLSESIEIYVSSSPKDYDTLGICNGDSILIGGQYQNTPGVYSYVISNSSVCDTLVFTTLNVNPTYEITIYDTIQQGDSVFIGGAWQSNTGVFIDSLVSVFSCDSIVVTNLDVDNGAGINQTQNNNFVEIYPNPSSSYFTIDYKIEETDVFIELLDLTGRSVQKIETKKTPGTIILNPFEDGFYIISLSTENGTIFSERVVKY